MNVTTIQINKDLHKRLRILAANTDKRLYQLIEEAAAYLEQKYSSQIIAERKNE